MAPLHGVSYSNLFSHYRPVGDPEWYTRSNPPDTPAPILDLDEAFQSHEMQCSAAPVDSSSPSHECRFQSGDDDEVDLHLSYEQRKQRWIAKTLPYWSKDIPPVHDGNGLFEYWKKVNNILEKKETV